MSRRLALFLAACTGLFVANLQADDVAALPGYNSTGSNVAVFGINPLSSVGNFTAGASTFVIVPKPDGSKYYVVAKSGTNSVTVVDTNFANPTTIASFQTTPSAAAITPDGGKLVAAAGTLHVFETTKDQELVAGGIDTGVSIFDVALSLDGKTAYTLGTSTSGGSQLNAINLTNNTKNPVQYGLLGTATGVAVGPNGRVYVSNQNQIVELDPTTLQPTTGGVIGVNALPGKVVFTPDGKFGLAVNQTPVTGQAILLLDLNARAIVNFVANLSVVFDTLLVASSSTVFAYSSQTESLYQLSIGSGGTISIGGASIGGAPTTFVNGVAISNEVPFPGRTIAQFLFVASANILYRIDLTVGTLTAQTALPNQPSTALEYLAPASTGTSPVALLAYGDKQTIAPNTNSLPLVVRALDTNGKPLSGATITFSSNLGSVSPTSVTTGSNGFAATILTAPSSNGTVTVTATDGKHPIPFTITVGTPTVQNAGTVAIIAGQGQLVLSGINTSVPNDGSPLQVLVTDLNGVPVSGAAVTFTIPSGGAGTVTKTATSGGSILPNGLVVNSDANGVASAGFLAGVVPVGLASLGTQITAKATGTNTVTFYETIYPTDRSLAPLIQFITPQSGQTLTGQAGTVITGAFTAEIVDGKGLPIPNVSVFACQPMPPTIGLGGMEMPGTCSVPPAGVPFGSCKDSTGNGVLSDAHGKSSCDLQLNGVVGSAPIGAQYGYAFDTKPFPLMITPGPPGNITLVQGNNQTGKPGTQLPTALVIKIMDSFGNVLPDYGPVTWSVLSTGVPATLQSTSAATDGTGSASTLVTLGSTVGVVIIQVAAGNASAEFTLTVASTAAGIQQVSGNNQTALVSAAFAAPLLVKVVDNQSNGVPGAPVTFTLATGSASAAIATPSTTTDATGVASTTITAGSAPGNISIVATSGTFTTTFTLTSHLMGPQNIVFLNGTSFQLQNGCQSPGCIAPGEIVTVQGMGFATGVQGVVSGLSILGPLPVTLAGVSITFNGVAAPIFYVANVNGAESMTIQVPFETPPGSTTVVLNAAGGLGTFTITTQPYAPGVFTSTYGNQTITVAVRSDGSYVSPTNPAHAGETIYVFATGLGQVSPPALTNTQGAGQSVAATVITGLNNKGVPHTTVDYAPGLVGVYIVGVQVPANTTTGPKQPFGLILVDSAGTKYYANSTYLPIQ